MLYSKKGSIPNVETDGTEGWIEVEDPPTVGDGEEVVWWYPPGWIVRPLKPEHEEGHIWKWNQTEFKWNKYRILLNIEEDVVENVNLDASLNTL